VRVAVVDVGTNSTRLLIADVRTGGGVTELVRESLVTRLGEGVDATGRLGDAPMARVFAVLDGYRELIERHGVQATTGVLTSAVRDAANGAHFTSVVRDRYGLDVRTISGEEEAALTFAGATSERSDGDAEVVVIDIGGGSTELVVGHGGAVEFFVSAQAGVVRQTERHLHGDPPTGAELASLAEEVRAILAAAVPAAWRARVTTGIAVAGTATQSAAIDLALEPYDRDAVQGHVLERARLQELLARLSALPEVQRRGVPGLDPARAPTIVAGVVMLGEVLEAFGLERVEVSENDILRGAALARAAEANRPPG